MKAVSKKIMEGIENNDEKCRDKRENNIINGEKRIENKRKESESEREMATRNRK